MNALLSLASVTLIGFALGFASRKFFDKIAPKEEDDE